MKGNDVEAITKLLKEHEVGLSAVKANKPIERKNGA